MSTKNEVKVSHNRLRTYKPTSLFAFIGVTPKLPGKNEFNRSFLSINPQSLKPK
jgi:hypothetical protein